VRIAAIYDIHGNVHALHAVLEEIQRASVDVILVGGDVAWGPFPRETVSLLQGLGDRATCIRGNADREVGARLQTGADDATDDVTLWAADQLSSSELGWLSALPESFRADVGEVGPTLFCHGSPRSDEEPLTPLTPDDRLRKAIAHVEMNMVVCGHTHMQFERRVDGTRVVNAGSVGLPYQKPAGAYWALLGPVVELRRTKYDIAASARAMSATSCPHVDDVFANIILRPPDANDVAPHFERNYLGA
jgi:putative phosphoesterase